MQPGNPGKEFGRRQVRPTTRGAGSERARNVRVVPGVVVAGQNTRDFLKPGATAYLGKATPQARRRMVAVLAVTGGVLFGAAITPHVTANAETVSKVVAGADLSATVVLPFMDRVADAAERLQHDVMRGTATVVDVATTSTASAVRGLNTAVRTVNAAIEATPGAIVNGAEEGVRLVGEAISESGAVVANNVVQPFVEHVADIGRRAAGDITHGTRVAVRAVSEAPGQAVGGAAYVGGQIADGAVQIVESVAQPVARGFDRAHSAVDVAGRAVRAGVEDWVEAQVAEMKTSAGMIRDGLAPAVAGLVDLAVKTIKVVAADMEREARLAEIDRTGVVVDIPGHKTYVDLKEHAEEVRQTMASLVDGIEKKIAQAEVSYPPAVTFDIADDLHDAPAPSSLVAENGRPVLTRRAAYQVEGGLVKIGGSTIRSDVVSSIAHAAKITGNDPVYLAALAARESAFRERNRATTSSATGLFQFIKSTWLMAVKQFGAQLGLGSVSDEIRPGRRGGYVVANPSRKAAILAMRNDPLVSGLVVSEMERSDRKVLEQALGRRATAGERYMSHFFGIADAVRMVSLSRQNPSAPAADYFRKAASANKSLFYAKGGRKYSVAEVIGGFKNWFEGPHGGMKRYAAFAHAAARVPAPTSPQYATVKKAAPEKRVAAPASSHPTRPMQTASLQTAPIEAAQPRVQPAATAIHIDEASLPPPTIQVRTPVKPGVPAGYKLGAGRISGYIDAAGRLGSWATSVARSQIISGFGSNFARLPAKIQDHLKNADQLDLNVLSSYARFMPPAMRDGFAKEGLTFHDAIPPSGGELVTVPNPKYEVAKREAMAAARVAAQEASSRADSPSGLVQTASLQTGDGAVADRNDTATVVAPAMSPPTGLSKLLKPTGNVTVETINWSPRQVTAVSRSLSYRMTDEEMRQTRALLQQPRILVHRRQIPAQNEATQAMDNFSMGPSGP